MKEKKSKKSKVIYVGDTGQTIYSMAALEGKTPEEQEEYQKRRKSFLAVTGRERRAMISAAFIVYGPLLLMLVGAFTAVALLMYLFLI